MQRVFFELNHYFVGPPQRPEGGIIALGDGPKGSEVPLPQKDPSSPLSVPNANVFVAEAQALTLIPNDVRNPELVGEWLYLEVQANIIMAKGQ